MCEDCRICEEGVWGVRVRCGLKTGGRTLCSEHVERLGDAVEDQVAGPEDAIAVEEEDLPV